MNARITQTTRDSVISLDEATLRACGLKDGSSVRLVPLNGAMLIVRDDAGLGDAEVDRHMAEVERVFGATLKRLAG